MSRTLRLIRAWGCYWVMRLIELALWPIPRSRTKARFVNALCGPFFGYGAYWALRSNPREGWRVKELERRDDA